ncbi:MAG: DNA-binding transcriptional MerR regulator [Halioglobus sp.]|jgi:DNA-binding transcriptional MerR regulator
MAKTALPQNDDTYRMAELVEESGVSRDMIKYYLRANLLPQADKPRPNLSLYSNQHLQLIRLILRFQEETKLSLGDIAAVFERARYNPNSIEIELLSDKFSAAAHDNIIPFEASTDNPGDTLSFPQDFIQELIRHQLWSDSASDHEENRKVAGLLWAARDAGLPLAFFQSAREKLRELAELEVKALIAIPHPELDFQSVITSVTEVDRIVNRWMITEKTNHARVLFQRIINNSEKALSTVHDAIYFPSAVFRTRFNTDAELTTLIASLETQKGTLEAKLVASRACLLLTDFEKAQTCADAALELDDDNDVAIAVKSLAYGMANNLEKALQWAKRLEASDTRHSIALEARLLTMLMQAAKMGGMSDTTDLLKDASELFSNPASAEPQDQFDKLEATLLHARANTLFPDAINGAPDAIVELEVMLARLATDTEEVAEFPFAAVRVVYQVYGNFYLAQLHQLLGNETETRQYYEHVIQLDPSSNFGETAYLKLAATGTQS